MVDGPLPHSVQPASHSGAICVEQVHLLYLSLLHPLENKLYLLSGAAKEELCVKSCFRAATAGSDNESLRRRWLWWPWSCSVCGIQQLSSVMSEFVYLCFPCVRVHVQHTGDDVVDVCKYRKISSYHSLLFYETPLRREIMYTFANFDKETCATREGHMLDSLGMESSLNQTLILNSLFRRLLKFNVNTNEKNKRKMLTPLHNREKLLHVDRRRRRWDIQKLGIFWIPFRLLTYFWTLSRLFLVLYFAT